ncbi:MAG: nitroreductase family protein [Brevinematales bacterium]|nr:nitroreductase family protein [Brevinematales bacterium]
MLETLIEKRRSLRALEPAPLNESELNLIKRAAMLAPSCFNNQPWRYIFVKERLNELFQALNKGNEWAKNASLIIAVFSEKKLDCIIGSREYYLFDTGIATGFMILQITELGFIAHPIAGFDEAKAKQILNIPENFTLISLIIVGKHNTNKNEFLNEYQKKIELERPERKDIKEIFYDEKYS